MDIKNKKNIFDVFWDMIFPFFVIVIFFWIVLWDRVALTWNFRMYMALLLSVFFNFFLNKFLIKSMKGFNNSSILYVFLWEITIPILAIFMTFLSIFKEYKFYDWNILTEKKNFGMVCIFVFLVVAFVFFLFRGFDFFKKNKKNVS
ncbi:hypothetical protein [Flavobacterium geliluteum]|uniref:Uncharacterized protein n=1 Tax=Flavobacterium geliluteum TaxID=2816120 RepID=A0A940XAM7_9FLAO|nr:hypothetical protein [Flavobacterium geliluteum]MBP4138902.1 hypothetical protein [Flavobacterium geliluteum]